MMHFPLCFRFPSYFLKFSDSVENFQNFAFSRKISRFSSAKMSDLFFPVSRKKIFPPYFQKCPPCFRKIHLLFTYFMCISFPLCFDHVAFMHHPMHVLDASVELVWIGEMNKV